MSVVDEETLAAVDRVADALERRVTPSPWDLAGLLGAAMVGVALCLLFGPWALGGFGALLVAASAGISGHVEQEAGKR